MIRHGYSTRALLPDYLRAAAGFAVTAGLVLFIALASVMLWILGVCAVLFVLFGVRTALRHWTNLELTADEIRATGPLGATIRWEELRDVDVRYFSTNRDRSGGWMQLTLRGGGKRIRVDSTIDDFPGLARRVALAATAQNVPISAASRTNLAALGVPLAGPTQTRRA